MIGIVGLQQSVSGGARAKQRGGCVVWSMAFDLPLFGCVSLTSLNSVHDAKDNPLGARLRLKDAFLYAPERREVKS